jgi:AAA domain
LPIDSCSRPLQRIAPALAKIESAGKNSPLCIRLKARFCSASDTRTTQERELRAAIRTHSPPRILDVLTERRSTFSRGDLNRELAKVIIDPKERAALNDQILSLPEVVGLKESAGAPVSRYTTCTVLKVEDQVIGDAAALAGQTRHGLTMVQGQATLDRHAQLSGEQRAAFWHATQAGGLAVIAGESGAGKSTVLAAVRDSYEAAGYRVIGMAWTNAVVQNLQRAGFDNATTIAAELKRLETGATQWDGRRRSRSAARSMIAADANSRSLFKRSRSALRSRAARLRSPRSVVSPLRSMPDATGPRCTVASRSSP